MVALEKLILSKAMGALALLDHVARMKTAGHRTLPGLQFLHLREGSCLHWPCQSPSGPVYTPCSSAAGLFEV